jgi:hypothetical protein
MLSQHVSAIERGDWRFPQICTAYLAHKYARSGTCTPPRPTGTCPTGCARSSSCSTCAPATRPPANPLVVPRTDEPSELERNFTPPRRPATWSSWPVEPDECYLLAV